MTDYAYVNKPTAHLPNLHSIYVALASCRICYVMLYNVL